MEAGFRAPRAAAWKVLKWTLSTGFSDSEDDKRSPAPSTCSQPRRSCDERTLEVDERGPCSELLLVLELEVGKRTSQPGTSTQLASKEVISGLQLRELPSSWRDRHFLAISSRRDSNLFRRLSMEFLKAV